VPRPHQSVLFVARVLFAISAKEDEVNCRDIDPGQRGKLKQDLGSSSLLFIHQWCWFAFSDDLVLPGSSPHANGFS
jgi:hypothetical protein